MAIWNYYEAAIHLGASSNHCLCMIARHPITDTGLGPGAIAQNLPGTVVLRNVIYWGEVLAVVAIQLIWLDWRNRRGDKGDIPENEKVKDALRVFAFSFSGIH